MYCVYIYNVYIYIYIYIYICRCVSQCCLTSIGFIVVTISPCN